MERGPEYREIAAIAGRSLVKVLAEKLAKLNQDIAESQAVEVLNDDPYAAGNL